MSRLAGKTRCHWWRKWYGRGNGTLICRAWGKVVIGDIQDEAGQAMAADELEAGTRFLSIWT